MPTYFCYLRNGFSKFYFWEIENLEGAMGFLFCQDFGWKKFEEDESV